MRELKVYDDAKSTYAEAVECTATEAVKVDIEPARVSVHPANTYIRTGKLTHPI